MAIPAVAHKKHWYVPSLDVRYPAGSIFRVSGDSKDMWIQDYNVRVSTFAEVIEQPMRADKKVLVRLNDIDHDKDVNVLINKRYLLERVN